MKFRNPRGDKVIEGRLPTKEENFSDDRYYVDDIENVFVRFDPYNDYVRVLFPCLCEIVFKITPKALDELSKKEDVTLIDLISACYNVEEVSTKPSFGFLPLSYDGDPEIYVRMKPEASTEH